MQKVIVFKEDGAWKTVFPAAESDLNVLAESVVPEGADWLEVDHPGGNVVFDGEAFVDYVEPHVARRLGSAREFLHLFTEAERLAFFAAKQSSAALELWWAEASTGQFSLDHPSVAQGLAQLVAAGLLAEDRKAEIMAADFDAVG